MKRTALASLTLLLVVGPLLGAELEPVSSPAAGITIQVPAGWAAVPLPTGLMSMAKERNERGQPVATLNVSREEGSFDALLEEVGARAVRKSQPGDEFSVVTIEHDAGRAFRLSRRSDTSAGLVQMLYAFYVDTGDAVWRLDWAVPPSDAPDRFEELATAVAASFRAE